MKNIKELKNILNNFVDISKKKTNNNKLFVIGIVVSFIFSIFAGYISGMYVSDRYMREIEPEFQRLKEIEKLRNLEFDMELVYLEINTDDDYILWDFNFTGINKYYEKFKNNVRLDIIFYESENLSVVDFFYNPQNVMYKIVDNTISFEWDLIEEKLNSDFGEINLYFQTKHSGSLVESDKLPKIKVWVEDFGNFYVNVHGLFYGWQ